MALGVSPEVVDGIQSFLENCSFLVRIDDVISKEIVVLGGGVYGMISMQCLVKSLIVFFIIMVSILGFSKYMYLQADSGCFL